MGEATSPTSMPAAAPVSLRFKALGHGNFGAQTERHRFFVQPQADFTGYRANYEAVIKQGQRVVIKQKDFRTVSGAKSWCQHWQQLNGGAVRRVSGGAR